MSLEQVAGYCIFAAIVISMVVVPVLMWWEDPGRRRAQEAQEGPDPSPGFLTTAGQTIDAGRTIVGFQKAMFNSEDARAIVVDPSAGFLVFRPDGVMTLQQHCEDAQAKAAEWRRQADELAAIAHGYSTDNSPALGGKEAT